VSPSAYVSRCDTVAFVDHGHTNRDVVVIIDGNEVAELQVTGHGSSLAGNTLHRAAITEECECVVVDQLVAGLVEDGGSMPLSNGETDGVGEALAERTGGDLDTGGIVGFWVAGCDAVELLGKSGVHIEEPGPAVGELTRKFFRSSMVTW